MLSRVFFQEQFSYMLKSSRFPFSSRQIIRSLRRRDHNVIKSQKKLQFFNKTAPKLCKGTCRAKKKIQNPWISAFELFVQPPTKLIHTFDLAQFFHFELCVVVVDRHKPFLHDGQFFSKAITFARSSVWI